MVVASSSVGIGKGAGGGWEEGGANSPAIWERGLAVILLSSSLWCITCSQCSHDSAFNGGYPFHVLQVSPPVHAAVFVWCCHGNQGVVSPAEHVRLPQVWLRVGTILLA